MNKIIILCVVYFLFLLSGANIVKCQIRNEYECQHNDNAAKIKVKELFDGGTCPSYQLEGNTIIFNLNKNIRTKGDHINIFVDNAADSIKISIIPSKNDSKNWKNQGLFYSHDGETYIQKEFDFADSIKMELQVETQGGIWIASTLPYGRNRLDMLYSDTHSSESLSTYLLKKENRIVPVFQYGKDDEKKTVHYIIAGECAWETAGQWVADYMIRELSRNIKLREKMTDKSVIRIIPHISPYSATTSYTSYAPMNGEKIYGAATWADEQPPPEYLLVREEIENLIHEQRLGLMLTVHSWNALFNFSGIETIRSSGDNRLEGKRHEWAKSVLSEIAKDVPRLEWGLPEKIWYGGLARDYFLRKYNAVTFRVEITTNTINYDFLDNCSRTLLKNIANIEDWSYVLDLK